MHLKLFHHPSKRADVIEYLESQGYTEAAESLRDLPEDASTAFVNNYVEANQIREAEVIITFRNIQGTPFIHLDER